MSNNKLFLTLYPIFHSLCFLCKDRILLNNKVCTELSAPTHGSGSNIKRGSDSGFRVGVTLAVYNKQIPTERESGI